MFSAYNIYSSCRRAFFSLQGAGLCKDGVSPKTAAELWRKVCNPVLTYGCETVNLTAKNRKNLDKIQAKLLKVSLGLPITARTTPLLDALKVPKASDIVDDNVLSLMKNIMNNSSRARSFYCFLIGRISCGYITKMSLPDQWKYALPETLIFIVICLMTGMQNKLTKIIVTLVFCQMV